MFSYGFNVRFYPADVVGPEARLIIDQTTWQPGQKVETKELVNVTVEHALQKLAGVHEPAWVLSILELVKAEIAQHASKADAGWVSGTCGKSD